MPYTTICWAEAQAMDGLTGMAAVNVGGDGFAISGDKQVFPSSNDWFLYGYGLAGDTKPQACNLLPDASNGNKGFYGPGAEMFYPYGWLDLQKFGGPYPRIMKGDSVTGQGANTNTNEGAVLGCHVTASPRPYPNRFPQGERFCELATVTSAAAVTANSGAVTIYSACTNTSNWYAAEARYWIIGVSGHISAATFGGMLNFTNISSWRGYNPGIPVNALSAVTFSSMGQFCPAPEPIGPITGIELSTTAKVGCTATSAGAVTFVLHMIRQ